MRPPFNRPSTSSTNRNRRSCCSTTRPTISRRPSTSNPTTISAITTWASTTPAAAGRRTSQHGREVLQGRLDVQPALCRRLQQSRHRAGPAGQVDDEASPQPQEVGTCAVRDDRASDHNNLCRVYMQKDDLESRRPGNAKDDFDKLKENTLPLQCDPNFLGLDQPGGNLRQAEEPR